MVEEIARRLIDNIGRVVLGKQDAVELTIVALFAGGHLLIEDRPGVGKTLLARALARSLDLPFQRLQCTSDLLPADILGAEIYHPSTGELVFRPGPVFTSVLVADELNRTPPRTQSALLQCMAEGAVTVDRATRALPEPFFVIATQNPSQSAGTYPLPESQLDRFLLRITLGAPDVVHEREIVARGDGHRGLDALEVVATADDVVRVQRAAREVWVEPEIDAYIVDLARYTRGHPDLRNGISTRGAQALHRACQARALIKGRDFAIPDDVKSLAAATFGHRVGLAGDATRAILADMLATVGSPEP